jgi:hypothetical protein
MPRLTAASVRDRLADSAIAPAVDVVTLSDGTEVPFSVVPWLHHRKLQDLAIRAKVAAELNGSALDLDLTTLGAAGVVYRSVLDHDMTPIFADERNADAWLMTLSSADLQLIEAAVVRVQEATALTDGTPTAETLAEVGKGFSLTTPS